MHVLTNVAICSLLAGYAAAAPKDLALDPFLRPYVEQLKKSTPPDDLAQITAMAESELILLHHGYGTAIRNRWIHGKRDPAIVQFFLAHKIAHPDDMSMILIKALWLDLNSRLTPEQRASIEKKRRIVARKRSAYEKLEAECEARLKKAQTDFERYYPIDPLIHAPFFKIVVNKSGRVRESSFSEDTSPELKPRLATAVKGFTFSPFIDDESVTVHCVRFTLYGVAFPSCRVAERDTLHAK
jgi:hypothetical protein